MASGQADHIYVGPNVQVSKSDEKYMMREVLLSADPENPDNLLGCGIVSAESENREWTVVYLSTDGGKSWQPVLETNHFVDSSDPACALGRNGLASHVTIGYVDKNHPVLGVYRSVDGGRTWKQQEGLPITFQGVDRESLTIDKRQTKFGNTIYLTGMSFVRDLGGNTKNGFAVWRSRDGGATFEGPWKRSAVANHWLVEMGNGVILSNGTLVSLFGDIKNFDPSKPYAVAPNKPEEEESNAVLEAVIVTEGGESISEAIKVDDFFMVLPPKGVSNLTLGAPTLAVDAGDGPFRDRLYATWSDERDGRSAIRISYSADSGKTWSKSIAIDDVQGPSDNKRGPNNFLPTVAVNKAGVVAVTWYDRRENPDGLGWYLRARVSLDGGETWLPSVRVSEKPNTFTEQQKIVIRGYVVPAADHTPGSSDGGGGPTRPTHLIVDLQNRQFYAGDYAGLAADANGTFHAFWVDNRTGLAQIWTASISVNGRAVRNGSAELAELEDVSSDTELKIVSISYDRAPNTVMIGVSLKNSSNKLIKGPVKLRLVNLSSRIGSPSPANADNHVTQPGAIWDLSRLLNDNRLKPGETSKVKKLVFRVDNPRGLLDGKNVQTGLLDFEVRVLAGGREP